MKKFYRYNAAWTVIAYHVIECGFNKLVNVGETYSLHEKITALNCGEFHVLLCDEIWLWFIEVKCRYFVDYFEKFQVAPKLDIKFSPQLLCDLISFQNFRFSRALILVNWFGFYLSYLWLNKISWFKNFKQTIEVH